MFFEIVPCLNRDSAGVPSYPEEIIKSRPVERADTPVEFGRGIRIRRRCDLVLAREMGFI